jgi:two-component system, chemotaxis family, chemotaxis protein CheY
MIADPATHILVVDDLEIIRRGIKLQLNKIGFSNVDTAEDGLEALTKLRTSNDYGLVISDLSMRGMNGLDLLRSVRSDADTRDLQFLMVTGENDPKHVMAAKDAGVTDYVLKPFSADTLRKRVEAILGQIPAPMRHLGAPNPARS